MLQRDGYDALTHCIRWSFHLATVGGSQERKRRRGGCYPQLYRAGPIFGNNVQRPEQKWEEDAMIGTGRCKNVPFPIWHLAKNDRFNTA